MKLRRLAEDFQVEEQVSLEPGGGDFSLYRLRKTHWTTLDAIASLARQLKVPRKHFSHAGLKDRHAQTVQYLTIRRGPSTDFDSGDLQLEYVGRTARALRAEDIVANRFRLVLRSLIDPERHAIASNLPDITRSGLVNYYDDQRFGSWFPNHGFIAEPWIRGNYEQALWLAFAEYSADDASQERQQKGILREHWGDWTTCKQELQRSHRRSIVTFLCDRPGDFKGAWGRVNADLRGLYLSALQSDLWNAMTSTMLTGQVPTEQQLTIHLKPGPVTFVRNLEEVTSRWLQAQQIPLPSARLDISPGPLREWIDDGLQARGWKLEELKVRYPRDRFFSRQRRAVLIVPSEMSAKFESDDLDPQREKVTLQFVLPPGSYATLLVKRLLGESSTDVNSVTEWRTL